MVMISNMVGFFFDPKEFVSRRIKTVTAKLFYIHNFHIDHFQLGVDHFCPTRILSNYFFMFLTTQIFRFRPKGIRDWQHVIGEALKTGELEHFLLVSFWISVASESGIFSWSVKNKKQSFSFARMNSVQPAVLSHC